MECGRTLTLLVSTDHSIIIQIILDSYAQIVFAAATGKEQIQLSDPMVTYNCQISFSDIIVRYNCQI